MTDEFTTWHADETPTAPARGVLLWLASMVFLILGFWLMGAGIDQESGVLFILGVLSCATALVLPVTSQP
ncbi:MAG TPA: hypothetical protein VF413_07225 [Cellulomonas sp.]